MKTYTAEEKAKAKSKLQKPIQEFFASAELRAAYMAFQQAHHLNLRQLVILTDIINAVLLGLEPRSAVETQLGRELPELSKDQIEKLILDINTNIFQEAQRRLQAIGRTYSGF